MPKSYKFATHCISKNSKSAEGLSQATHRQTFKSRKEHKMARIPKHLLRLIPADGFMKFISFSASFRKIRRFYLFLRTVVNSSETWAPQYNFEESKFELGIMLLLKAFIFLTLLLTIMVALYIAKSLLGIDLFPDKHLSDYLPILYR